MVDGLGASLACEALVSEPGALMAASTLGAGRELHTSVSGRSYHNVVCLSINSSQISRRSLRRLRKAQVCCSALVLSVHGSNSGSFEEQEQRPQTFERFSYLDNPERQEPTQQPEKEKPLVRVQLSVHYRVHSRQMLCIGGSQIPFGWSFLSIAKVPMTWNQGDIWTCEVRPPVSVLSSPALHTA